MSKEYRYQFTEYLFVEFHCELCSVHATPGEFKDRAALFLRSGPPSTQIGQELNENAHQTG